MSTDATTAPVQNIVRLGGFCETALKCLPIVSVCWEPDGIGCPQTQFVVDETHDPMANGDSIVIVPKEFRCRVNAMLGTLRLQLNSDVPFVQDYDRGDGHFVEASI